MQAAFCAYEARSIAQPPGRRSLGPVRALSFATAQKAGTYRAVLAAFAESRVRYVPSLRAHEVLDLLERSPFATDLEGGDGLDTILGQLKDWELLRRTEDNAPVHTKAEYLSRREIWQITETGLAAHEAVVRVDAALARTGSLQKVLLADIAADLTYLRGLAGAVGDPSVGTSAASVFGRLDAAFTNMTDNAARFIANLDELTSAADIDRERFLLAKTRIVEYVTDFVRELQTKAPAIGAIATGLAEDDVRRLAEAAAAETELAGGLREGEDPVAARIAEIEASWAGLRVWFVGSRSEPARYRALEGQAQTAIASLIRVLERIWEASRGRIPRAADFMALARWFAALDDADDAHRLWRTAFGLSGTRHFTLAVPDPELVRGRPSWLDVPPVHVAPRLRAVGRASSAGRFGPATDRSRERALIAEQERVRRERRAIALARFVDQGAFRLSELGVVSDDELDALLELRPAPSRIRRRTVSAKPRAQTAAWRSDSSSLLRRPGPRSGRRAAISGAATSVRGHERGDVDRRAGRRRASACDRDRAG